MNAEINKQCPKVATKKGLTYLDLHKKKHNVHMLQRQIQVVCMERVETGAWQWGQGSDARSTLLLLSFVLHFFRSGYAGSGRVVDALGDVALGVGVAMVLIHTVRGRGKRMQQPQGEKQVSEGTHLEMGLAGMTHLG